MKKLITILCSFVLCISLFGCQKETKDYIAKIEVKDYGTITVKLDGKTAPITVQNFVDLAKSGFYDGLTFHRIIEGFMIQGGDPNGNGTGGSDKTIKGEFKENGVKNNIKHKRGVISMARSSDYDSASSQFFIMQEDNDSLDGQYAAFGHVTKGMKVVDKICEDADPMDDNGTIAQSKQPVIKTITVSEINDQSNLVVFLYIKILASEQGNAVCEKLPNCHNLLIMRNDKKDYRNSQHFAFAFQLLNYFFTIIL